MSKRSGAEIRPTRVRIASYRVVSPGKSSEFALSRTGSMSVPGRIGFGKEPSPAYKVNITVRRISHNNYGTSTRDTAETGNNPASFPRSLAEFSRLADETINPAALERARLSID